MHGVDRAAGGRRGDDREQRGGNDAEADFLAFHVAAGQPERMERGGTVGFRPIGDGDAGDEQHAHHGQDRPALTLVADHAAEHVGQRGAEREYRNHLDEVRQRGRVLERMRGVGIEEAAAIGAEHFDGDLGGDRTDRDGLLGAFQRRRIDVSAERLRHALPYQKQRVDDADRQQDVKGTARDIDPEIADGAQRGPGEAADQRHREHDAGCRGEEVLVRQPQHLHEVGQRAFAAVILPVGVGDEADRGVEGQVLGDGGLFGRIERQHRLQPHYRIDDEKAADMEQQHGDRIGQPMLLALLVDAADPVKPGLDRPQDRREERALAIEDARHVPAERFDQRDDDRAVQNNLNPADGGHGICPLDLREMCRNAVRTARAAAGRRSGKTAGLRRRDRRANNRRSWLFSSRAFSSEAVAVRVKETRQNSKPFAGVGVTYSRHEEAEAQGQHDGVQHEVLLCVMISGTRETAFSPLSGVEVPPGA